MKWSLMRMCTSWLCPFKFSIILLLFLIFLRPTNLGYNQQRLTLTLLSRLKPNKVNQFISDLFSLSLPNALSCSDFVMIVANWIHCPFSQVTLRPYVVKEVQVTPAPSSASKWDILIPAILVPVCVTLFLLIALICNKCASKRKRKRQKIEPTDEEVTFLLVVKWKSVRLI